MLIDQAQWALDRGIEGLTARHQVLANNIANIDSPGFKRSDVSFRAQLARSLGKSSRLPLAATHPDHLGQPQALQDFKPQIVTDTTTTMRADGNNVDVDREMAELARNTLSYGALTGLASRHLARLGTAITQGRR